MSKAQPEHSISIDTLQTNVFLEDGNSDFWDQCHICLENFYVGEEQCVSPNCRHLYHHSCLRRIFLLLVSVIPVILRVFFTQFYAYIFISLIYFRVTNYSSFLICILFLIYKYKYIKIKSYLLRLNVKIININYL